MPRRPREHVIGDQALQAVAKVCAEAGFACDQVLSDYGEDLIVQPTLNGMIDPFRIVIQVKGTSRPELPRQKSRTIRVGLSHFQKWVHSSDPVLAVLWNVTDGRGVWLHVDHLDNDAYVLRARSVSLKFDVRRTFDSEALSRFAWRARLMHYDTIIAVANAYRDLEEKGSPSDHIWKVREYNAVEYLLTQLHVIDDERLAAQFVDVHAADVKIARRHASDRQGFDAEAAMARAFLRHIQSLGCEGAPMHLCAACAFHMADAVSAEEFEKSEVRAGRVCVRRGPDGRRVYSLPQAPSSLKSRVHQRTELRNRL